eukprot:5880079-Pyramimonas_sp.AAC.2
MGVRERRALAHSAPRAPGCCAIRVGRGGHRASTAGVREGSSARSAAPAPGCRLRRVRGVSERLIMIKPRMMRDCCSEGVGKVQEATKRKPQRWIS